MDDSTKRLTQFSLLQKSTYFRHCKI